MELASCGELTMRISYYLFPQVPGQELDALRRWTGIAHPGDGDEWLPCARRRPEAGVVGTGLRELH
jgi:hypothetical protein